jgi:hypothetical protein
VRYSAVEGIDPGIEIRKGWKSVEEIDGISGVPDCSPKAVKTQILSKKACVSKVYWHLAKSESVGGFSVIHAASEALPLAPRLTFASAPIDWRRAAFGRTMNENCSDVSK